MSQIIRRLEAEIASANDPLVRGVAAAKLAAQLARIGDFDDARKLIEELRMVWGASQSGVVTVWVMLAEGLIHLYEKLSPDALDRITRAQLLGIALRNSPIVAIASSWKAHIEFELSDFAAMVTSLKLASDNAQPNDHDSNARIAIVLANSFMTCGDEDQSQRWFMRGRDHAARNGDQASMEALVYNKAAFSVAALRIAKCIAGVDPNRLRLVRMEVESAKNFHGLTRITSYTNHNEILDARLKILEAKYEEAILALTQVRGRDPFLTHNFLQSYVELEIAYCEFKLGKIDSAVDRCGSLDTSELLQLDVDEQLVAAQMLLELTQGDERFGDAHQAQRSFETLLQQCRLSQEELRRRLVAFVV
jgi:hypothetical protein